MLVSVLAAGAGAVATAGTAAAQSTDTTESWDVQVTINPDGSVDVVEDIVQVFEEPNRHGIERRLAIRQGTDDPDLDRLYTLGEIGVTSPSVHPPTSPSGTRAATGCCGSAIPPRPSRAARSTASSTATRTS